MARSCEIVLALLVAAAMASPLALAYDPSPLQDFCVADKASDVFVNGHVCKDPAQVTAGDFAFSGLQNAGDTANAFGSKVTLVNVGAVPGLNSLGVSMARLDLAPGGLNPPHTHPLATEVLTIVDGEMYVGFLATDGTLFARVLSKGDVFVFPKGLVHFEFNFGARPAVGIAGLSSQNPGLIRVADSLFGASPAINDEVLAKAFRIDAATVQRIKAQFATKK
ncbi:putative germin-like protein 2-1 [Dichanthelium oligosanthes]|uniref:Germin-like protein n=1 Tax=Dichanthelium oligosanthes TaxID=888268 RepID=A0A1E5WCH4_9POAL|nr:putative germin-like protein 2-1 [Dichanthelium oligosanthes]